MIKRLTVAVVVMLAVFSAAVRMPAQACALNMPAAEKMSCGDCCAKMKSCALPQKDQAPPATASTANQQSIALIAPAVQTLLLQIPVVQSKADRRVADTAPKSSPRQALLCTFLI
jgi:hypothetical protein